MGNGAYGMLASALASCARVACALAETHRDTLSAQRAAATKTLRAEVKLVTCAQLSQGGS